MRSVPVPLFCLEVALRWTARVLTVLLVGMFLWFFLADIAGGGTNPFKLAVLDALRLTFLFMTCIGLMLAWRWPFVGGVISFVGILLYYAVDVVVRGSFVNILYFDLMLLAGILFMVCALIKRRMSVG